MSQPTLISRQHALRFGRSFLKKTTRFGRKQLAVATPKVARFLERVCSKAPYRNITLHITRKCAALMVMASAPSLIFAGMLVSLPLIFNSPKQNAYFYFARMIDQDPINWLIILLSGTCAALALVIPAIQPEEPRESSTR